MYRVEKYHSSEIQIKTKVVYTFYRMLYNKTHMVIIERARWTHTKLHNLK